MMKKRLGRAVSLLLCLSLLLGLIAPAAAVTAEDLAVPQASDSEYEIYPTPHSVTYGAGTVTLPATMQVTYDAGIDSYTKDRAVEAFGEAGVTLSESATTDVKLQVRINANLNPGKYDAYTVTVDAAGVTVVGQDTDAAFYGLTTVKRILQQVENKTVRTLTVEDYADVPFRGFIEGYYGNPWTVEDRAALMEFGGEYKMNIYFYAPKDDPKHSTEWRELYTEEELETKIRPLAEAGNASKCYYGYALHPFWANGINYADETQYQKDLEVLKAKYEQVMGVGVRQIAVLADDRGLPTVNSSYTEAENTRASYVKLLTDLTEWVSSDEMQAKYPGLKTSIPFCPNAYMNNGSSSQIQTLVDELPESVPIVLTGGAIWGHVSHSFLNTYRTNTSGGRTFMWVNWPCSDNSKTSLTMGAHDVILHSDLTQEDINTLQGVMINPMQQSEPSKAGIFQLADYTWNIWNGSDSAQRTADVWDDCFKYVDHDSAIETPASTALRELSKHMIRQNGNGNNSYNESVELAPKLTAFRTKLASGTLTQADVTAMRSEFETLNTAAKLYINEENAGNKRLLGKRNADGTYPDNLEQMAPWLDCWVEFSQANLDLLDALSLILDNSSGANDSRIVDKYLAGQGSLTASQGHKFWYVDHYETAKVGGQHLVPFTDDLLSVVAEEAQTILNPSVLTETIITNRSDTPAGGLAAMRDGNPATEAVFKSPNSIAIGDYVGVRYNRPISVTSVRFEVGTAANSNDTFNDSKLQYMDESGQWVDIPGATFAHTDLVLEATGLDLTTRGVRAIATSVRSGTWFGVKEIYINGQSGGVGDGEVTTGQLTGTIIRTSLWSVSGNNPESNLTDGNDSTCVYYDSDGSGNPNSDNSMVGDYIGLDFGYVVENVGRVRFVIGSGSSDDKWTDFKLQYSTDNVNWTDVNTYNSTNQQDIIEEDLGGVAARYVRFVNTKQIKKWLYFAELSVWADNSSAIVYRSEKLGRLAKPVGTLTDDSASLKADLVMLRPGEFVGIALPRIRSITEIAADYTDAPGVVLEVGMSEDEMTVVDPANLAAYTGNARYIRLRNSGSTQTVSFRLDNLSVKSEEISGISYVSANGCQPESASDNPMLWFDGDVGTRAKFAYDQSVGNWVLFDLGQTREIRSLRATINNTDNDYPRNGVWEVSDSPNSTTWTPVLTITTTLGAGQDDYNNPPSTNGSTEWQQDTANYFYQENTLQTPVSGRYLRYRVTSASSNYLRFNEITINGGEYVPTSNDPTFEADPIEQAGYAPENMRDGNLTTAFRPNMDGKTSGSITYRLSDETNIGQINVLADANCSGEVFVREVGGSTFQSLGTLGGGLTQLTVPAAFSGVAEIMLSWGDTTPTIYELITVARDEVEEGGQASSGTETVPINSYGGSDCSILFDENWKFNLGDASGAQAKVYNDSAWRTVNLPHDYAIEQSFTSAGEAESGYLIGGIGWYRKSFTVDPSWAGKTVTIDFGGVYMDTEVYLNGTKLGEHHYGYSPFSFVLPSDLLNYTGENVIAVKTNDAFPSSRWYSGAGIYRSVYLTVSDPVHVAKYGTKVETTNAGVVNVKTTVQNDGASAANVTVEQAIYELDGTTFEKKGNAVATAAGTAANPAANGTAAVTQTLNVASPKLWNTWDKGTPSLYVLVTTVKQGDTVLDTYETEFGFRTIAFTSDDGFKLNGQNLKLKGVCQHHDQGALGSEAWYRALERQVDILMDMGVNSIRVTHNPAADELIEICNRKGVLVIDELFDGWHRAKNGNSGDFSRWFSTQIASDNAVVNGSGKTWAQLVTETVVNRDKNAPCVIMYSLGNEIAEGATFDANYATNAENLISWAQAIDTTRPLTYGQNGNNVNNLKTAVADKIHAAGGVIGINYYSSFDFATAHSDWGWLVYASETVSHVNSRGVYNVKGNQAFNSDKLLTSYDKSCVGWGAVASDGWWRTIQYDYDMGEYIWTGFDYIGEPTPANGTGSGWASGENSPKSSYFGAIDTNGLPKDNYWLYRSMWNDKSHTLHILPTWDRSDLIIDSSGKVEVVVYTDAPMVKLYLNGNEVGSATSTTHATSAGHVYRTFNSGTGAFVSRADTSHQTLYATFNVTYAEGTLRAVACDAQGNELTNWESRGRSEVKTTSGAFKLVVKADRTTIKNDGRDLSYITIDVVDANSNIVNGATPEITVNVTGDGVFMGLDNGVQPDHTSYLSNTRKAGAGELVAIVQSTKTEGKFTVTATADGLESGFVEVTTSGAASTVDDTTPVSYDIIKSIYVQRGVEPDLPETATVTLGNGTTVQKAVTWGSYNKSLLNTVGSEFAITGTIADYNIPVSVGVMVMDDVAALLNYSTAIRVGGTPTLPATRPAVMADGTVLNAQFPVTWETPAANAFIRQGTVEIHGTATVFNKTLDVTAWVRVAEGSVIVGDSVSSVAKRPTVDGATDEELLKAYDGDDATVWTGSGTTKVEFDTQQNLYRIVLTYQDAAPTSGVTLALESGAVTVSPTIDGKTATYELGSIRASEYVTITFSNTVNLADVALIVGTPTFDVYSTAELDGLRFNGENAAAAELASRTVTTSQLMPAIVPVSGSNVAYTILPEDNGTVIIVTESENQANRDKYTVHLGGEGQQYNDYPYSKTTASAGSDNGGTVGSAVDGNENTIWHSAYNNGSEEANASTKLTDFPEKRWFMLTLDDAADLVALRYKPRSNQTNGTVHEYRIEVSMDGTNFTKVAEGTWDSSASWKIATFDKVTAKYVRLWGDSTYGDGSQANYFMSAAEVRVVMAEKEDMSPAMVTVTPAEQHWRNVALEAAEVVVTLFGEMLHEGTDYELVYENNRDVGTAYVYAVAKSDSDYQGSAYGTFIIKMAEVEGDGLEKRTIWVQEGVKPELPETIWVGMSDGHHQAWEVKWDDIPEAYYINPTGKQFKVYGTVVGATERAELTVNVAHAASVDGVSAMTVAGAAPALPSVVNVQFEDGVSRMCRVTWNLEDTEWTAGQTVRVTGTLENIGRITATASVRVGTGTANDNNIALNNNSAIFPFALALWSSGDNNPYQAIKGQTSGSTAAGNRWSDWERDTRHDSVWMGVAFETSTQLSGRQQNQTLTLVPHLVNKANVMFVDETGGTTGAVTFPDSYKIQYYTGPVENLTFDTRESTETLQAGNGRFRAWGENSPLNDDSNWKDVTVTGSYPAVPSANGQMLEISFDVVQTAIIRVLCTPQSGNKWVGIQALEVYGMNPPEANHSFTVRTITLGGVDKKAEFDSSADKVLEIELADGDPIPQLNVTVDGADNASVSIIQASRVPGKAEAGGAWAIARITAEDGETTQTYTVKFTRAGLADKKYSITKVVEPAADADKVTLSVADPSQVEADTEVTITVEREGYRLAAPWVVVDQCYHADNDHRGQIIDVVDNKFIMPMGDVTLTTSITLASYEITYDLDGGVVSRANPTSYTIESSNITLRNPTKAGYTFQGWVEAANPTANPVETVTIATGSTGDRTYTAKWRPVSYNISYNLSGGTNSPANPATYTAEDETFTLSAPTRDGYNFLGWLGTGLGNDPVQVVAIATGSAGHRNYTAVWSVNKDELNAAIAAAVEAKADVEGRPEGTTADQVDKGTKFVPQDVMDALNEALTNARDVVNDSETTQAQVDEAKDALLQAASDFTAAIQTGTKDDSGTVTPPTDADKTELNAAIAAADAAKTANGLVTKPAGTTADQVDKDTKFVTQDAVDALNAAIAAAQAVADDPSATQTQVNDAKAALEAAVRTFNAAITDGTKENGGTSQTEPGTVLPLDPTPSKPDDDTTTTVVKNDDGSTTTTVTDNKTGVVTATTERVDGSTVVKVTEANKDVTITVTDAEGEVLAKVKLPAEIPAPETRFVDVPEGHWADEAIHSMAALELVKGVGNDIFDRNGAMKRGDLALILSRMSSAGEGYELTFTDVPATKYYANGVAWAAKAGVVTGRSEETFAPEDTITREELAMMLYRYAELIGVDTRASNVELDAFADGSSTHSWAATGMAWCVKCGILQGRSNGDLDPRTNVTRAEVAMMLKRFMDLLK